VAPIAPLTPPTTSTFLGTGNTVTPLGTDVPSAVGTTATFPGSGGGRASASESRPSAPGGGGDSFKDCMGFWDAGTHMNKKEWAAACRRVTNRLESLRQEINQPSPSAGPRARTARKRGG
jgi:hypothetical protein